jgi:hypothetical protein
MISSRELISMYGELTENDNVAAHAVRFPGHEQCMTDVDARCWSSRASDRGTTERRDESGTTT